MRRDAEAYLCDILQACERIAAYTAGLDRRTFEEARVIQDGVMLRLQVIGEALSQMRRHFPERAARFGNIQGMIDLRNYLVHQYHAVSTEIIWAIIREDIPVLRKLVEELLGGTECL